VVVIRPPKGGIHKTFALLDCASEVTLLCEEVRQFHRSGRSKWLKTDLSMHKTQNLNHCVMCCSVLNPWTASASSKFKTLILIPILNLSKKPISHEKVVRKWHHLAENPLSCIGAEEVPTTCLNIAMFRFCRMLRS
jgi:hypothetical protein